MKRVSDWTAEEVLGFCSWPAFMTVVEIRKQLLHWEQRHPELLTTQKGK